jgi:hypothetical protein
MEVYAESPVRRLMRLLSGRLLSGRRAKAKCRDESLISGPVLTAAAHADQYAHFLAHDARLTPPDRLRAPKSEPYSQLGATAYQASCALHGQVPSQTRALAVQPTRLLITVAPPRSKDYD